MTENTTITLAELPPGIAVAVVAGFPPGAHPVAAKVAEAAAAVAAGADEVDMVIDIGASHTAAILEGLPR